MKVLKRDDNFYEICLKDDINIDCDISVGVSIVYSNPHDGCKYLSLKKWSSQYDLEDKVLKVRLEPDFIYAIDIEYGEGLPYRCQSYRFIKASEGLVIDVSLVDRGLL